MDEAGAQSLEAQTKAEQETVALTLLRAGYTVRLRKRQSSTGRAKTVYMVDYWRGEF